MTNFPKQFAKLSEIPDALWQRQGFMLVLLSTVSLYVSRSVESFFGLSIPNLVDTLDRTCLVSVGRQP